MKERGMIFNGEMVRAILDGRKTQTRRIMKVQPESNQLGLLLITDSTKHSDIGKYHWAESNATGNHVRSKLFSCPFGAVGDRIWVRETFQGPLFDYDLMDSYCKDATPFEKPEFCVYKADGVPAPEFYDADDELHCCWRPSIHMPRWASRILLEITDVRVERLKSISDRDALREGCSTADMKSGDCVADVFARLWASIYGSDSWNANPWVWVIEFKLVE